VATLGVLPGDEEADETTHAGIENMVGHYKRSKFLAEEEARRLVREAHLPAVIVNPSAPVGPRDIKPTPTGRMILDAAAGRMPAYVDTGLNIVHVDDVASGHLLAFQHGVVGERYILGGANMSLKQILTEVAAIAGRRPPRVSLPHNLVLPVAYVAEGVARFSGREPRVTVDGVKLAKKRMYFSSDKARRELYFTPRPARRALEDAVNWFKTYGYVG
jgi:dihydroflavonol-4-reductase